MNLKPRVFLCYATEDQERVSELRQRLIEAGIEPWMDIADLLPGERLDVTIPRALRSSDCVIVFLSRNSVAKRGFVRREFNLILDAVKEVPESRIFLIPARLDDCAVPEAFRQYVCANLSLEGEFEKVCRAITSGRGWMGDVSPAKPSDQPSGKRCPPEEKVEIVRGVSFEFVPLPEGGLRGRVQRGMRADQSPIKAPLEMGRYPVTQAQWTRLIGRNPSYFQGRSNPVEQVSWMDVRLFVRRLNQSTLGWEYRLPSEAEWEYAARAGSLRETPEMLEGVAWYSGNSEGTTHPVGLKEPNAWGLSDMLGNVWEWLAEPSLDEPEETGSPGRPSVAGRQYVKGGSWDSPAEVCTYSSRESALGTYASRSVGFRLLRQTISRSD